MISEKCATFAMAGEEGENNMASVLTSRGFWFDGNKL
jgi:hypothetical protein